MIAKRIAVFLVVLIFLFIGVLGCSKKGADIETSSESVLKSFKDSKTQTTISTQNSKTTDSKNSDEKNSTSKLDQSKSSQENTPPSFVYQYQTDNGIAYNADGFISDNNGFSFTSKLTLTFSGSDFNNFNRISINYTSSENLLCKIYYKINGASVLDELYLEDGTNSFNALIAEYLQNKSANNLTKIELTPINFGNVNFCLHQIDSKSVTVYSNQIHYLENSRFKLGINLIWGGGICYVEDKQNVISGLTNLVNQADTGRLIQQSYYGTDGSNSDYVSSKYNQNDWPYNPVQGGDLYQNHSRLIDINVTNNSVYIKSQPQDWAKNNQITPSYMENVYTLNADSIRVDNRFIDFSSWSHRVASQELPAFYTVSFLDEFTWYNGSKSWQDDALTTVKDLPFWGEAQNQSACTFYQKYSNTETWCAWTNASENYGIGLFVPNTDSLLAGRHAFDGSKDPLSSSCNYVAPVNDIELESFEAIEYSYLITCGSLSQIRNVFKENKDFATNESLKNNCVSRRVSDEHITDNINCTINGSQALFSNINNTTCEFAHEVGAVKLTSTGVDSYVSLNYKNAETALYADNYDKLIIEYMIPTKNTSLGYNCDIFLCAGATLNPDGNMRVRESLIADGKFNKLTIDLSALTYFSGELNQIRFDFFDTCQVGDAMYIKSFVLE